MKQKTLVQDSSSVQGMTPLEALALLDEHEFQFIAWKTDRSTVYAMAHTEEELLAKLAELGVEPDQTRIKQIGAIDPTSDFGLRTV